MSDKIEIQGKTVEAAVSEALLQMGARRDEVEIKVLEEPKSGFMGFLGGRPAKVLVRKKRSRGRGGSGRDHRSDDENYQAHNLSGGRSSSRRRGGSGRSGGGSGGSDGGRGSKDNRNNARNNTRNDARNDSRNDGQQEARGEKSGSRRGSRGRGGRGRSQGGESRNQQQAQNTGRQDQPVNARNQDAPQGKSSGGRGRNDRNRRGPDNRTEQRVDSKASNRPAEQDTAAPVNARNQRNQRNDRNQRNERPERIERPARQDRPERSERPERNAESNPRNQRNQRNQRAEERPPRTEAPVPTPAAVVAPPEMKEETSVTPPPVKRRAFGGLGSRIKAKKAAAQAETTAPKAAPAAAPTPAPAPEAPRAAGVARDTRPEPEAAPAPRYETRAPERHAPSRSSSDYGDEMILEGIKAGKYASQVAEVTEENLDETLTEMTDSLLARAGFPCRCETLPGEYRQIKVTTDDASAGMLIGRHGQAIDAVEHLVERMASNAIDARARINLDINNYRLRREEALVDRIAEADAKIRETGRPFHMEPMSARERRIIHLEAEKFGGLRTFTMDGSGGKHVVIALDEEAEAAAEKAPEVQPEYEEPNGNVDGGSGEPNNY